MKKESKEGWVWFGYAGHFIGSARCCYHLTTIVKNKYLISTVGDYRPLDGNDRKTIGAGDKEFYETYVFKCDGINKDGNPNVLDWLEIDGERFADSLKAEKGHYKFCYKYDKKD